MHIKRISLSEKSEDKTLLRILVRLPRRMDKTGLYEIIKQIAGVYHVNID